MYIPQVIHEESIDKEEASNIPSRVSEFSPLKKQDDQETFYWQSIRKGHVSLKTRPNSSEISLSATKKMKIVTPEAKQIKNNGSFREKSVEVLSDLVFCLDPSAMFSCSVKDFRFDNSETNIPETSPADDIPETIPDTVSYDSNDSFDTYFSEITEQYGVNSNVLRNAQDITNFKIKAEKRLSFLEHKPMLQQIDFLKALAEKLSHDKFDSKFNHNILVELVNEKLRSLVDRMKHQRYVEKHNSTL